MRIGIAQFTHKHVLNSRGDNIVCRVAHPVARVLGYEIINRVHTVTFLVDNDSENSEGNLLTVRIISPQEEFSSDENLRFVGTAHGTTTRNSWSLFTIGDPLECLIGELTEMGGKIEVINKGSHDHASNIKWIIEYVLHKSDELREKLRGL